MDRFKDFQEEPRQQPSEIERALELGCRLLKFFPAENAGGAKMLKALAGRIQWESLTGHRP